MRIALFHNYYKLRGGEDVVFELECEALEAQGHEVFPFSIHNNIVFSRASALDKILIAWRTPHNQNSYKSVLDFLKTIQPDVGHVHNWFPILSPAVYAAHQTLGIPVVQTLHNYRLGCAAGTYRRKGKACNLCSVGNNWSAVQHRCYRGSLLGSYAWKRMTDKGWSSGTFTDSVTRYICPSQEVATRHIEMGIPENRISVIPNACKDPLNGQIKAPPTDSSGSVVFLGRMVHEKGVDTLIDAWRLLSKSNAISESRSLTLVGTGPDFERHAYATRAEPGIRFTGQLDHKEAMQKVSSASVLLFPSRWAEPFGLGVIEAMAAGRPVIASNLGGPAELVEHGATGLLVPPDNPQALSEALSTLLSDTKRMNQMGQAARQKYLKHYQPRSHATALTNLFESLIEKQIAC